MPNGIPEPAMQPLHPDKPEPPIVAGDVWQKIATGTKTSKNAPRCEIIGHDPAMRWGVAVLHINGKRAGARQDFSERVFRRDWRPC